MNRLQILLTDWVVLPSLAVLVTCASALDDNPPKTLQLDLGEGVKLDLVLVPAGEFHMGAPESENERQSAEEPVHKVKITRPFYLGAFEITNVQSRRFRPGHHSRYLDGDNQPALWVSWYDADAFCHWLSQKIQRNVRLPSEAEWEYACRAGTATRFFNGDQAQQKFSPNLDKAGCSGSNSRGLSKEVGKFIPNAFGLYDMHGNVWEWCSDWYDPFYLGGNVKDPQGPPLGVTKVIRSGSWKGLNRFCRSASRGSSIPFITGSNVGFRVVLAPASP